MCGWNCGHTGELLHAELTQDRYRELKIGAESQVFVSPRSIKVFSPQQGVLAKGEGNRDVYVNGEGI